MHKAERPQVQPATLNVDEAAHYLGIGRTKVWELMNGGELAWVPLGRRRVIRKETLDALLASRERAGCSKK